MSLCRIAIGCLLVATLALPAPLFAQQAAQPPGGTPPQAAPKELVAVLSFEAVGATKEQSSAVTDRLEDALLKAGTYTLVDRTQKKKILNEQAFQEKVCTEQDCAVQAGRLLGAKRIVVGRLTKIDDSTWQLSGQLLDVETGQTLKAETIPHKGDYFSLLKETTVRLAAKLSGTTPPPPAAPQAAVPPAQAQPQGAAAPPASKEQQEEPSIAGPVMTWTGLGLGLFFTAMAQAFKSSDSSGSSDPGVQILTNLSYLSFAVALVGVGLWVHESHQKSAVADIDAPGWFVGGPILEIPTASQPASTLAMQVGYRYRW